MIKALFLYRRFIYESIKREFLSRYANSLFGCVWAIVQPLSMIIVYTMIFTQIMAAKLQGIDSIFSYSIYLCAGIISWGLFVDVSTRSVSMFIDHASFLKKVRIPKICLPAIVLGTSIVNFCIIFVLYVFFLIIIDFFPGLIILYSIPLFLLLSLMALTIGIFLGTINVFFRDIGQFYSVVIQFWFWLTPIVYPASIVPQKFSAILTYNPIYIIINQLHAIFVYRKVPDFVALLPLTALVLTCSVLVLLFFRKHSEEIVDEL